MGYQGVDQCADPRRGIAGSLAHVGVRLQGKNLDVQEIAHRLKVGAVLEGSVRRSGNRLRVAAQLVDAVSGYHLWSETYDRQFADVFEVQDELSRLIVATLRPKLRLSDAEPLVVPPTRSEAYTAYLKGRFFWNKRTPDAVRKAIEYFERALEAGRCQNYAFGEMPDWPDAYHIRESTRRSPARVLAAIQGTGSSSPGTAARSAHGGGPCLSSLRGFPPDRLGLARRGTGFPPRGRTQSQVRTCPPLVGLAPRRAETARGSSPGGSTGRRRSPSRRSSIRVWGISDHANRPDEGADASRRALELDPNYVFAYETMALGYIRQQKYEDAILAALEQGQTGRRARRPLWCRGFLR